MRKERELSESLCGKRIAWLIPGVNRGSGGLQTIFRHASHLHSKGAICDFHIIPGGLVQTEEEATELLVNEYDCPGCRVFPLMQLDSSYDAVIATMWTTVRFAVDADIPHKFYFVQDFEPWFYPMGDEYIKAEETYRQPVVAITIGKWLAAKLYRDYDMQALVTDFCADSSIYHNLSSPREHAMCVCFQPEKPRRCTHLVLETLELLSAADPTLKLYAFGSDQIDPNLGRFATNLGILSKAGCNELYNRCEVGLTISTSNPSRIPFEMMSAGLPVVDIYRENNLYDFTDDSILLVPPSPDALASAILEISSNPARQEDMRAAGTKVMSERPIEGETDQFAEHVVRVLSEETGAAPSVIKRSYHGERTETLPHVSQCYRAMIHRQIEDQILLHNRSTDEATAAGMEQNQSHSSLAYRCLRKIKRLLLD